MLLTYKYLKSIYKRINESVFEGKLPNYKLFIRTECKNDDFDTPYAWFELEGNKVNGIVFNQFEWYVDFDAFASDCDITIEEAAIHYAKEPEEKYEEESEIIGTMAHEMIHAWMHFIGHPNLHHDETFIGWGKHAAKVLNLDIEQIIEKEHWYSDEVGNCVVHK